MKTPRNELNYELFSPNLLESHSEMNFYKLEEIIFNLTPENVDDCVNIINENFAETKYDVVFSLIAYVSDHRPFSWPLLALIISKIPRPKVPLKCSKFVNYLVKKGAMEEKYCRHRVITQLSADEMEGEYPLWTLERNIREDDLDRVAFLATEPNFHRTKMMVKGREVSLLSGAAYYASVKVFKYLVINHTDFNYELSECAVMGGNEEILQICKQNGCFFKGCVPLAIEYHRNDIAKWILQEFGLDTVTIQHCIKSFNTLALAFLSTNKYYLTEKTSAGVTPIMVAADAGRFECIKYMVEHGAKTTSRDKDGKSAMHRAAKNGYIDIIAYLLENGVNIDDSDKEGNTPILYAVVKRHINVVKFLIEKGANVNKRDKERRSPLIRAIKNDDLEMVNLLLDNGSNVDENIKSGQTPLIYAATNGHIEILKTLIKHGAKVNAHDSKGMTAMMHAAEEWYLEIIRILIKNGADATMTDYKGKTASDHTYSDEIKELLRIST